MKKTKNQTAEALDIHDNQKNIHPDQVNHLNEVINFLDTSLGFKYELNGSLIRMTQIEDGKVVSFNLNSVEKVLLRQDFDGSYFLQINFMGGIKILITKNLVGFKPVELSGFDSQKIPKVVTTVDLQSVIKAIEDTYDEESYQAEVELSVLKKVYYSILLGAEAAGFEMKIEKDWYLRSMLNRSAEAG